MKAYFVIYLRQLKIFLSINDIAEKEKEYHDE